MKTIIYARVSSDKQAKNQTIQSQLEVLREYANRENLEVIQEILDDGFSGTTLNRPGMDEVRELFRAGKAEAILVLSPDRLARKQSSLLILMDEFKKFNINIIFTNQQYGNSPEDTLMLQLQGAIAEYEREKIIDRTRRGSLHSMKCGQVWGGHAPYGYTYVNKTANKMGHYEIDPQEADTIKKIFHWYVIEGLSGSAITNRLMELGIPSRSSVNKWWSTAIYTILRNETYAGTAYANKTKGAAPPKHPKVKAYRTKIKSSKVMRPREEWIAIQVPQIIDRELWEKAQVKLEKNKRSSKRNNKKNKYMLRGLVICGECGSMVTGSVSNTKTYYSCGAKRNKNITTKPHDDKNVTVRHEKLDTLVWQELTAMLDDPERLEGCIVSTIDRRQSKSNLPNVNLDKLEKELQKLAVQEQRILDAYREEIITLDELRDQKAKITEQIKLVEARKKAILTQQNHVKQPKFTKEVLGDIGERYKRIMANADHQTREKLANLLINRVVLYPDKARVEGNIPIVNDVLSSADFDPARKKLVSRFIGSKPPNIFTHLNEKKDHQPGNRLVL